MCESVCESVCEIMCEIMCDIMCESVHNRKCMNEGVYERGVYASVCERVV
jgi:hypothetical protein